MNKLRGMLLAVLLFAVANTWSACFNVYNNNTFPIGNAKICNCNGACATSDVCGPCPSQWDRTSDPVRPFVYINGVNQTASDIRCSSTPGSCAANSLNKQCKYSMACDTKYEADSVNCELTGNIWQDGACKENHCKAADSTWLSTSIAACTGSNNYALVNTDSMCEHVGTCCPNDSIPSGNTCKWRCDSVLTTCNGRVGSLFGAVLPDTSVSGEDTTFSYQCFYNCAYSPNPDSTVYLVEGNTVLSGPNDSIADGIKSEWFSSVRSTTGSIYVYDYLSPSASEYVDSIAAMKCVEHLWRCVINNKYVYWYDNQEVPAGCTNIVRVK